MSIIDERGRLFGRLNLVDAAVGALLLALMPAAYGAYLLFKEPVPKLVAVVPPTLRKGPNLEVVIRGENLRPYMRISFSDAQGRTFLFNNPTTAVVQLPDVPPGKYDIVLFDYMQEVDRLKGALTIEPTPAPPTAVVDVNGVLTSLSEQQVKDLKPGHRFPEDERATAELLEVGTAEPELMHIKIGDKSMLALPGVGPLQLPVRIRTTCVLEMTTDGALRCTVTNIPLGPDANVRFLGLGTALNMRVSDVHYPGRSQTATVRVRFIVSQDVASRVKKGDLDLGGRAHPAGSMATLVSLTEKGDANAATLRDDRIRQSVPTGRLIALEGVLSVPVQQAALGWTYKDALVKIGSPFSFETATYTMDGGVVELTVAEALSAAPDTSVKPFAR